MRDYPMNKKHIILFSIFLGIVVCIGIFIFHTQRQKNIEKTRILIDPVYTYSGKLTQEEQKQFTGFLDSFMNVGESEVKKYVLPKQERLQLEAHINTIYYYNPEIVFREPVGLNKVEDIRPYQRYFGILAVIAKTKLADIPAGNRSTILQHLEILNRRLTKNSIEIYMEHLKDIPPGPSPKLSPFAFGIQSTTPVSGDQWIMEADGSLHLPEGGKRGGIQIIDNYGNEYTVDFDSPADTGVTEDTEKLYSHIDRLFESLTDAEFHRFSTLSKSDRTREIENILSE